MSKSRSAVGRIGSSGSVRIYSSSAAAKPHKSSTGTTSTKSSGKTKK